ncbi:MAG TPA: hypothetical protein VML57_08925 [Burkholderiales bacterium]|nr:hypothetical protein [Burkholderiales bacterium]
MTQPNPYQAPKAVVDTGVEVSEGIEKVASGQKLVIYAILVNFLTIGLQVLIGPPASLLALVALVLSLVGIYRVGSGMGFSMVAKIGLIVLMFVPLINLITLLVLNGRATARLRDAGYKVGLLGASR